MRNFLANIYEKLLSRHICNCLADIYERLFSTHKLFHIKSLPWPVIMGAPATTIILWYRRQYFRNVASQLSCGQVIAVFYLGGYAVVLGSFWDRAIREGALPHWALEHWCVTLQPKYVISEPNGTKIIQFDSKSGHSNSKNVSKIHILYLRDFLWKIWEIFFEML